MIYPSAYPYINRKINYLHIGSGSAAVFTKLLLLGFSIHNIDINKELCAEYNKIGYNSHYGTINEVDFPNESFDLIYISHVFEHLLHPKKELTKLRNWLKRDGIIICQFPLYPSGHRYGRQTRLFQLPLRRVLLWAVRPA